MFQSGIGTVLNGSLSFDEERSKRCAKSWSGVGSLKWWSMFESTNSAKRRSRSMTSVSLLLIGRIGIVLGESCSDVIKRSRVGYLL